MTNPQKKLSLNLLVVINAPQDTEVMDNIFHKLGFPLSYRLRGEGTASNEIMDLLGLHCKDKAVTLSVLPRFAVYRVLRAFSEELGLYKPGHGIAFSVPLSGINGPATTHIGGHFSEEITQQLENEVSQMLNTTDYCLVLAAVEQGYSEEVMDSAKECGVTGGTVIHARRLGNEEKLKFWGISFQSEREVIAIIVEKEKKLALMQAIGEKYGLKSKAHGVILALPVEGICGLSQPPVI